MRAIDIIRSVDELEPNQFGIERKLKWLSELDGQIYGEIGEIYEPRDEEPGCYKTGDEELLIEFPYGESIYTQFLQAMMAAENFEIAKYNQHITMFDSTYAQYRDRVTRTHMHIKTGMPFRF